MPDKSSRLLRFWEELKRRKVIKVIAMYAATAFIIMEAGDIMLPRLGLPDWTITFIIILLLVGFPIAVIFSWIFDITPEGLKKTEPVNPAIRIPDPTEFILLKYFGICQTPNNYNQNCYNSITQLQFLFSRRRG